MENDGSSTARSRERSRSRSTPDDWASRWSSPPDVDTGRSGWPTALLRRWSGTSPVMVQPPLDHHYVVQHLGGAKRVRRRRDGASVSAVVACESLTIVPAGTEFVWRTDGPIAFAHLYLPPSLLTRVAARFDRQSHFELIDRVGCRDPLLESLFGAMLDAAVVGGAGLGTYLDGLLQAFLVRLLASHTTAGVKAPARRETLPSFRLRRVQDFVETHLDRRLTVADLARVSGSSVFHFSRAFRNAVGEPPYQYLSRIRFERAQRLLHATALPVSEIAAVCGFGDAAQLSRAFVGRIGTTPTRYRRS